MKISVQDHQFCFTVNWPEDSLDSTRPDVSTAVDGALYLLTRIYPYDKVQREANSWEA